MGAAKQYDESATMLRSMNMTQTRRLIRGPEVRSQVGLSNSTIYNKIKEGTFPAPVPIGERAKAWDSFAVDEWVEEKIKNAERAAANNDSSDMYSDGAEKGSKKIGSVQSLAGRRGKL